MRLYILFCLLFLPFLHAAPAPSGSADGSVFSASSTPDESTSGSGSRTVAPSRNQSTTRANSHKPTVGTTKKHVVTTTRPAGQITYRPVPTTHTVTPPAPSNFHPRPPHHQSIASLVLIILGALAGIIFFLSVVRCIYSYNRTPQRDRISSILHRHQLQREMEELERNPPDLRRGSLVDPPPPYLAPPSYPDDPHTADEHTPLSRRQSISYAEDPRGQDSALRPNG
ncbi:hypothetical protein C8R43DRAFT_972893 [Mycena crocata]|nr:hypothetical protein C8R43DRAFT_972893 [Mycena crocata]